VVTIYTKSLRGGLDGGIERSRYRGGRSEVEGFGVL